MSRTASVSSVAVVIVVITSACGRIDNGAPRVDDAGTADATRALDGGASASDAGSSDAGAVGDARAAADGGVITCATGAIVAPVAVLNASPVDPALACDVGNAIGRDDRVAGLDLAGATELACSTWDDGADGGLNVGGCGCIAVDLGGVAPIAAATIRVAARPFACTAACVGTRCGTGRQLTAWTGTELGAYRFVSKVTVTDVLTDYEVPIARDARYVVLCRDRWTEEADDIVVDDIVTRCL